MLAGLTSAHAQAPRSADKRRLNHIARHSATAVTVAKPANDVFVGGHLILHIGGHIKLAN